MSEEFVANMIDIYPFQAPGVVALDLGGHYGDYTAKLAEKFEKVYVFEPFPDNLEKLRERFKDNPKVTIIPKAVYNKTGKHKLYLNGGDNMGSLSTIFGQSCAWDYNPTKWIEVDTITLDDFVAEEKIANIGFIKMDIEGGEQYAFRGAGKTLSRLYPHAWIVIEAHLLVDWDAINDLLHDAGFNFIGSDFQPCDEMYPGGHFLICKADVHFDVVVKQGEGE
jgi:FkbM family methyltransferase